MVLFSAEKESYQRNAWLNFANKKNKFFKLYRLRFLSDSLCASLSVNPFLLTLYTTRANKQVDVLSELPAAEFWKWNSLWRGAVVVRRKKRYRMCAKKISFGLRQTAKTTFAGCRPGTSAASA